MRNWTIHTHGSQADLTITGDTLPAAIEDSFDAIARHAGVGNAAGYHLEQVELVPTGDAGSRAVLRISAKGRHLDEILPDVDVTEVTVLGLEPGDLDGRHEFALER